MSHSSWSSRRNIPIRVQREELGDPEAVAKALGISARTIYRYENAKVPPELYRLALVGLKVEQEGV